MTQSLTEYVEHSASNKRAVTDVLVNQILTTKPREFDKGWLVDSEWFFINGSNQVIFNAKRSCYAGTLMLIEFCNTNNLSLSSNDSTTIGFLVQNALKRNAIKAHKADILKKRKQCVDQNKRNQIIQLQNNIKKDQKKLATLQENN